MNLPTSGNQHPPKPFNSAFRYVVLPFLGLISITMVLGIILVTQTTSNPSNLAHWTNISIIFIATLLVIPGLVLLMVLIGMIILLNKTSSPLQSSLRKIQHMNLAISSLFLRLINIILKPIYFTDSVMNNLRTKMERYQDKFDGNKKKQ